MPCLTTVETCPGIVGVGGDLTGVVLRGLADILAPELGIGIVRSRSLRLGTILHKGLGSGHWVAKTLGPLETVLLASLALHELAFVVLLLICPGSFSEDSHVH
jgi:hypothetical protein